MIEATEMKKETQMKRSLCIGLAIAIAISPIAAAAADNETDQDTASAVSAAPAAQVYEMTIQKANLLILQKKWDEAHALLRTVLKNEARDDKVYLYLGDIDAGRDQLARAIKVWRRGVSRIPTSTALRYRLVAHFLTTGNNKQLRTELDAFPLEYQKSERYRFYEGVYAFRTGSLDNALTAFDALGNEGGDYANDALYWLGRTAEAQKDTSAARKAFVRALEFEADPASIRIIERAISGLNGPDAGKALTIIAGLGVDGDSNVRLLPDDPGTGAAAIRLWGFSSIEYLPLKIGGSRLGGNTMIYQNINLPVGTSSSLLLNTQ